MKEQKKYICINNPKNCQYSYGNPNRKFLEKNSEESTGRGSTEQATTYSKSLKKTLEHVPALRHGVVVAHTLSDTSPGSKLADCAGSSRVFSPCDVSFTGKNGTNCPLSLTSYTGET